MTIPTLILTPRYTPDAQLLWNAANAKGWHVIRLNKWKLNEDVYRAVVPVLYVEGLFAQSFGRKLGLTLLEPPEDFLPKLPEEFRKRNIVLTTLGEARKATEPAFVKPPNDKSFPAKVYKPEELPTYFEDSMPVLSSECVYWKKEFRCFIMNKRIYTASPYMWDGKVLTEQGYKCVEEELYMAMGFAQTVLNEVDVPDAVVMDVGYIKDRGWAVIELNAAWGSGIYGCDPDKVLDVVKGCMLHTAKRVKD